MNLIYLSLNPETPDRGYWDHGIVNYLTAGLKEVNIDDVDGAVVVFPARAQADRVEELNNVLKRLKWVVLILTGDEEAVFPVEQINHRNIRIWVQNPRPGRHEPYRKIGTGFTPHTTEFRPRDAIKDIDWFFSGQITHQRRENLRKILSRLDNGEAHYSKSFTAGLEPKEYVEKMAHAKVAPAPSGPELPDTFRLFEALELGAVPIADTKTDKQDFNDYWQFMFDEEPPFPILSEYDQLPGYIQDTLAKYPVINNRIYAWWQRYKLKLRHQLFQDIKELGGFVDLPQVTAVVPVSPIKSHPSTEVVDTVIESIIHHLPGAEIIVTFDGVRPEQENKREDYEEFIRRLLWKWNGVINPFIFDDHMHQSGMMKAVIDEIKTPLLLYMEQDTPLVTDYLIHWEKLQEFILDGRSNFIRFHFEAQIPEPHKHMMIGEPSELLLKTIQWSQRPHLSSVAFYRRILEENFSSSAKCFIEDLMHGRLEQAYRIDGMSGWNQFRAHIYHPKGQIKRSYHLDGRAGAEKYDDSQVF